MVYLKTWLGTNFPNNKYQVLNGTKIYSNDTGISNSSNLLNETANFSISGFSKTGGKNKKTVSKKNNSKNANIKNVTRKNVTSKSKKEKRSRVKDSKKEKGKSKIKEKNIISENIDTAFKETIDQIKKNKKNKDRIFLIKIKDLRLNNKYHKIIKI
jgi:hypothetical protein